MMLLYCVVPQSTLVLLISIQHHGHTSQNLCCWVNPPFTPLGNCLMLLCCAVPIKHPGSVYKHPMPWANIPNLCCWGTPPHSTGKQPPATDHSPWSAAKAQHSPGSKLNTGCVQARGRWEHNGFEWKWQKASKILHRQTPHVSLDTWDRLYYPQSKASDPVFNPHVVYWELWKQAAHEQNAPDHAAQAAATLWKPHIQWIPQYCPTMRAIFDNSKDNQWSISELLEWTSLPVESCKCRAIAQLDPNILDPHTGHVRTANIDTALKAAINRKMFRFARVNKLHTIRSWFRKGRGFRPGFLQPDQPNEIWKSTHESFSGSMSAAFRLMKYHPGLVANHTFKPWRWRRPVYTQRKLCSMREVRACKKWLQKHLTVTSVDKSSKNFAFVCKWSYRWTLWTRLNSEGEMARLPTDSCTDAGVQLAALVAGKPKNIVGTPCSAENKDMPATFPPLIGSVKMKKILDDSKTSEEKASIDTWRFITAASTGPVKEACAMHAIIGSKLDSVYYDHCLRVSKRWTRMLPKSLKGRRIRVYRQAKDVAHILCNMPSEANWISNADISKMFERLPRNGLLSIKSTCAWKFRLCLQEK